LQISDWGGASDPVNAKRLLVDLENVQPVDLSQLDDDFQCFLFLMNSQTAVLRESAISTGGGNLF
jgi:hypothetical protein